MLADFYELLFGCERVPPERDYPAADVEAGTGVPGSGIAGVHLRLPGYGANGPTLEIYSYAVSSDGSSPAVNRPGFAHIAFAVDDVRAAREQVLAAGGTAVGAVVTVTTATGTRITWCYVADPEGNVIELQSSQ
jgi:catechol 2,3-dioxygenase-like lactoylglutathione lyase family enzyme